MLSVYGKPALFSLAYVPIVLCSLDDLMGYCSVMCIFWLKGLFAIDGLDISQLGYQNVLFLQVRPSIFFKVFNT